MSTPLNTFTFVAENKKRLLTLILVMDIILDPLYSLVFSKVAFLPLTIVNVSICIIALILLNRYEKSLPYLSGIFVMYAMISILYITLNEPTSMITTNYLYSMIIPIIAIFFLGINVGVIATVIFCIFLSWLSWIRFASEFQMNPIAFMNNMSQILLAIGVVTLTLYFYENTIKKSRQRIHEDANKIEIANRELTTTIATLENQKQELEKTNKLMIGRELKMIALKREIETLKKQLATKTNQL